MTQTPELFDPVSQVNPENLLRNSRVFAEANEVQRQLEGGVEYARADQAYEAAASLAYELDRLAENEALLGRQAILRGSPLYLPTAVAKGLTLPYVSVAEKNKNEDSGEGVTAFDNTYQEARGLFTGFVPGVDIILDEDADPRAYLPHLMYQVELGQHVVSPLINGALCAAGTVGEAQIEFDEDHRYITSVTATYDILSLAQHNATTERALRFIETCHERPIIKSLRFLGLQIERMIKSGVDRPDIFAEVLLQLPKVELEDKVVEIEAKHATTVRKIEDGEKSGNAEPVYHPEGAHVVAKIDDIIMMRRAYYQPASRGDTVGKVWIGGPSPHLRFENDDRVIYIAFGDVVRADYSN